MRRVLLGLGALLVASAAVGGASQKIFVERIKPTNMKASAAEAIDVAICGAAHEDKRFDTSCAQDVRNILAYDSTLALLGAPAKCEGEGCSERISARVEADFLLSGTIAKLGKGKYLLTLELIETASAKSVARIEEHVSGDGEEVFERAGGAAKKLLARKR